MTFSKCPNLSVLQFPDLYDNIHFIELQGQKKLVHVKYLAQKTFNYVNYDCYDYQIDGMMAFSTNFHGI